MAKFLSRLNIGLLREATGGERAQWVLLSDFTYESDLLGKITVPALEQTDLASVPHVPIAWLLAGGVANAAAVIHDFLYTYRPCTRAQADQVFLEAMKASGVPYWQRALMYAAVRVGGRGAWREGEQQHNPKGRKRMIQLKVVCMSLAILIMGAIGVACLPGCATNPMSDPERFAVRVELARTALRGVKIAALDLEIKGKLTQGESADIREKAEDIAKVLDQVQACANDSTKCVVFGKDFTDPLEQLKAVNAALDALEKKLEAKRVETPKLQA